MTFSPKFSYIDGNGTSISEMRYISPEELDPLVPYANSTGVWTDTDKDGIPDVAETYLSNRSKWSYFATHYSSLWNNYSRISEYFKTVKRNQNESAAEKWLSDQFNPTIVEHTPPQVLRFNVKFYYYLLTAYVEYHVVIVDAGKISKVVFKNLDNGDVKVFTPDSGYLEFSGSFYATPWGANLGFKLKLFAKDVAGNRMSFTKEIKGPVGQWIDTLAKIWSEIWNVLVKVGKEIAKAVEFIVHWQVEQFMDMFNTALDTAKSVMYEFISTVIWDIYGLYEGNVSMREFVADIMSSKVFMVMLGFMVGLTILNYAILATGIGGAILTAISAALLVASGITMIGIGISFVLNPSDNVLKGWVESILNYVTGHNSTSNKQLKATAYHLYANESDEELFEEVSLFVLPLFWMISALAAENIILVSFAVGLDLCVLLLGPMYHTEMEKYHFDKNQTINITRGLIATVVGGIIVAEIGIIGALDENNAVVAIFDLIVIAWGLIDLYLLYKDYFNLIGGDDNA